MSATDAPLDPELAEAKRLTVGERSERGREARRLTPRKTHAAFTPPERDPVAILEAQGKDRVQELIPIRYGRMLESPFAFYRGAAAIMANDLAAQATSGLRVQLVGDAHLANFGGYASPERNLIFDVNDFDETHPGPFEWDVKRLATSVEIAGRAIKLSNGDRRAAVMGTASSYRAAMRAFAKMRNLDVWYDRADIAALVDEIDRARERKDIEAQAARARTTAPTHYVESLTETVDGRLRIVSKPPYVVPIEDLLDGHPDREEHLRGVFNLYRRSLTGDRRRLLESYTYEHLARKVVGVGSVGLRCWIMLLLGRDERDPLLLQIKEAGPSVLEAHLGKGEYANEGQRVVEGQRLSQSASDIFLGWTRVDDPRGVSRHYYVRQLRDWKLSIDVEHVMRRSLETYAGWCAWSLARAHACSGDRVALAAFLGKNDSFDRAIASFATAYADLNDRDHAALAAAAADGRIVAQTDAAKD